MASDGSDDDTEAVVATFAERGVRLLALQRVGKAAALNAAADVATGEILVFSDANSLYAADAIRRLVPAIRRAVGRRGCRGTSAIGRSRRPTRRRQASRCTGTSTAS